MRRIVTGLDENGLSTVESSDEIDGMDVWEAEVSAAPAWVHGVGKLMPFEPDAGQVKVMSVTFPPETNDPGAVTEREEGTATGLHKTRSVDVILVREPMVLILETGEVEIAAGDVVIQQATMHDWRNPGNEPARMLGFSWGVAGHVEPEAVTHGD
jgi:hypothetical protein